MCGKFVPHDTRGLNYYNDRDYRALTQKLGMLFSRQLSSKFSWYSSACPHFSSSTYPKHSII